MFHEVTIIGNLGGDPSMSYLPSGVAVTRFSVASNRSYTNSAGEKVKETTWFRVSVFGKQAEACAEYQKKGHLCLVKGRFSSDPQSGGPKVFQRQDGTSGASYEVVASTVRFLGGGNREGDSGATGKPEPASEQEQPAGAGDDFSF